MDARLLPCIALTLTCATFAHAQTLADRLCPERVIPFVFHANREIVTARDYTFAASTSHSMGGFFLMNESDQSIIEVMVNVEHFDASGRRILNILYHARSEQAEAEADSAYWPPGARSPQYLVNPIPPGGMISLGGYSAFTSTSCPVEARATTVYVGFAKGSRTGYTSSHGDWKQDPRIETAPQYFDMRSPAVSPPADILITARVDQQGRISTLDAAGQPAMTANWLLSQLKQWRFIPAIDNGEPLEAELVLLLRFRLDRSDDNSDWFSHRPTQAPQILVVVTIGPWRPERGEWVVRYGIEAASRILPESDLPSPQ